MIVLGLHFGHDASVAVIDNGKIRSFVLRERHSRTKHAATLTKEVVELALAEAGITPSQIDFAAIASTQVIGPVFDEPEYMSISLEKNKDLFRSRFFEHLSETGDDISRYRNASLLDTVFNPPVGNSFQHDVWTRLFPEHQSVNRSQVTSLIGLIPISV